jgi:hypothetical protein
MVSCPPVFPCFVPPGSFAASFKPDASGKGFVVQLICATQAGSEVIESIKQKLFVQ